MGRRHAWIAIAATFAGACTGPMTNSPPAERVHLVGASPPTVARQHWTASSAATGSTLRVGAAAEPVCVIGSAIEVRQMVRTSEAQRPEWIVPESIAAVVLLGGGVALEAVSGRLSSVAGTDAMTGKPTPSPRTAARIWGGISIALGGWSGLDAAFAYTRSGERVLAERSAPASNIPVPCPPGVPQVVAGELVFASPFMRAPLGVVQPGAVEYFDLTPLLAPGTSLTVGNAGRLEIDDQPVAQVDLASLRLQLGIVDEPPLAHDGTAADADDRPLRLERSKREDALIALLKAGGWEWVRRQGVDGGGLGGVLVQGVGAHFRDQDIEEGLRLFLPDTTERQVGVLVRIVGSIYEGELSRASVTRAMFRDELVHRMKSTFPDDEKSIDIVDFLWDLKVRRGGE
jgi:hypothetical protein